MVTKKCSENGCKHYAREQKSGKCKKHGGGKRCSEIGCVNSAIDGGFDKCIKHGGGKKCSEIGCVNSARSGFDKCIKHGGGKKCTKNGCDKKAIDGFDKCKKHGGGKQCFEFGCNNSARNGFDKCKKHGGGKRCSEKKCNNSAIDSYDKCVKHGGGIRCTENGCNNSAQGATNKCAKHGGGYRCPNCINWVDSRIGKSKYDGYCATCFKRVFPNDERSKIVHEHTKEIRVRNMINENFDGFIHDTPLYTGNCDCTHRRRVDHRKLINETILAIETDEFGHRGYDGRDEEIRYDDLYMIHSGKWIFIRFNPDSNVSKIDIEDKLEKLIETMNECIERIESNKNTDLVEIIKLYI